MIGKIEMKLHPLTTAEKMTKYAKTNELRCFRYFRCNEAFLFQRNFSFINSFYPRFQISFGILLMRNFWQRINEKFEVNAKKFNIYLP